MYDLMFFFALLYQSDFPFERNNGITSAMIIPRNANAAIIGITENTSFGNCI